LYKKFVASLLAVLSLVFATTYIADAHASLIKADPAPNSLVSTAPRQLTLWFDEPLDLSFTTVQVLDSSRARFDAGVISTAPGDPKQLRVPLKEMPDGTYTVAWKVLSAADGHATLGNYAFSIGKVTATVATTAESTAGESSPISIFARWVDLAAILALVGGIFFRETVLTRSLGAVQADETIADARWEQLVRATLIIALVAEAARLALEASFVTDAITPQSIARILFETRLGTLWIWRFTLLAILGFLLFRVKPRTALALSALSFLFFVFVYFGGLGNYASPETLSKIASALIASWNAGTPFDAVVIGVLFLALFVTGAFKEGKPRRVVLAILTLATLATVSLSGHGAAQGDYSFAVFADWLHLTAVSFWVGGLITLIWVVTAVWRALPSDKQRVALATLIPNFSVVALISVAVIVITGLYASIQQIPSLDALIQTIYGESLTIKVVLFLVMLALGAVHLLATGKRFVAARQVNAPRLFRNFRWLIAVEAAVGAIAIAFAGLMTLSPPPRGTILATQYAQSIPVPSGALVLFARPAPDLSVSLSSRPDNTPQTFDTLIGDANKQPALNVLRVIYEFTLLDQDIGVTRVNVDSGSQGHYLASGSYLTIPGMWRVRVIVRRAGVEDVAATFPFYRAGPTPGASDSSALDLLKQADSQMNRLKAMRSVEELNDGENGVVVTRMEFQAPDRVHTMVEGGSETIAIGTTQYFRESSGWTSLSRPELYVFPSFNNAGLASGGRFGREETLDGVSTQIVDVDFTSSAGDTHFAYWVGKDDRLIHQYAMVAPSHYMIESNRDFNAPVQIDAPKDIVPSAAQALAPGSSAPAAPSPRTPGPITGDLESDGALGLLIVALAVALRATDGGRTRSSRIVTIAIALALALAALFLFNDAITAANRQFASAPIDAAQAASGRVLYEQNCLVCHGETGYGNGPAAASLRTKPYDLTVHALQHDDPYFLAVMGNGRGEMPTFRGKLTTADMLSLIQYMRQLARDAQATQ
jgi:copper transport protein